VQLIYPKNIGQLVRSKIIISCFLLCCSFPAIAQNDQDSVTVVEEVKADPPSEENQETGEKEKEYFLQKTAFSTDSLSLQQRKIPDSITKKMQEDDDFWYANAIIEKEKKKEQKEDSSYVPLGQRTWFKTLIWLIIIGSFAAVLMMYLSGSNVGLFRKKSKPVATDDDETITEDIFAINYQKEIDKAAAQGNYRLAIRLMFLRLLKNMSEKNIIQYKQDRTNFDYLLQLHPTKYYDNFFRITRNYEYSWYGQFEVSEEAYRIIRNDFDHFENGLR
jgi:hypothetical protein